MFLNPDESLTVFSSKGKLDQCDNALKAALNGTLSVGCGSEDGAVLMAFKNTSKLVENMHYHRVFAVCPTIGVTYSGLQPDFRVQLELSQRICGEYYEVYARYPSLDVFVAEFSLCVQEHTQKGGMRPLGTFLIFAGRGEHNMYQMDPSGSYRPVTSIAAGTGYGEAQSFISRRREQLDDNIVTCLIALTTYTGKSVSASDVSIGVYESKSGKFRVYDYEMISEVFDSISEQQ